MLLMASLYHPANRLLKHLCQFHHLFLRLEEHIINYFKVSRNISICSCKLICSCKQWHCCQPPMSHHCCWLNNTTMCVATLLCMIIDILTIKCHVHTSCFLCDEKLQLPTKGKHFDFSFSLELITSGLYLSEIRGYLYLVFWPKCCINLHIRY